MARSFPQNPNFDQLKNQAKDLLRSHRSHDSSVCPTLRHLNRFADASDAEILAAVLTLHEAQFALALDYGFSSWDALKKRPLTKTVVSSGRQRFSEDARKAVYYAQEMAREEGAAVVDIGQLLRGVAKDKESPGAQILQAVALINPIDPEEIASLEDDGAGHQISQRFRLAIDHAYEEAHLEGCGFVGSQHVLLGILRGLTEAAGHARAAEQRLQFARELVRRQPKNLAQRKGFEAYCKELADVGGDPDVLQLLQIPKEKSDNPPREYIIEIDDGRPELLTEQIDSGALRTSGPAETAGRLADIYRAKAEKYIELLASHKLPERANRTKIMVESDDPAHPEILLHVKFTEVEDTSV